MEKIVLGIPIKYTPACIDPSQAPIPMILTVITVKGGVYTKKHVVNIPDYGRYRIIIEEFIKNNEINKVYHG